MVKAKLKPVKTTVKREVLADEGHVFWSSEFFDNDETKPTYLVIDNYPAGGNPTSTVSLTQNLVYNQVANQLGGRGFWLAHLYTKMPALLTNNGFEHVDEEFADASLAELLRLANEATNVVIATGSISRKYQAASDRLGAVLDALANAVPDKPIDFLVSGDTDLPGAVVSRHVRVGSGDWILMPKDDVVWWKGE